MKNSSLLIVYLLFIISVAKAQNVGINASGAVPDASAMLDIVATDKGLLVPRVALTALNVAAPITSPLISLLVYNTATAGTTPNNVVPGYYYWDGTKWVTFAGNGGKDWALLGNAGTVAGTNFLGTTDNVDLQFRVNNIQGGKINIASNQTFFGYQSGLATTGTGNSFFGSSAGIANIGGTHNTAVGYLTFTTSTTGNFNTTVGYGSMRSNLSGSNNTFLGTNAGANWSTTSNNTGVGMFALQGLNAGTGTGNTALGYGAGSGTTPNNLATGNGSYNTFLGYNSAINNSAFNNATAIGANALAGANDVMVLGSINGTNGATSDTKVGIGITIPTERLHVNGNVRFSNALMPNNLAGTAGQVLVSQGAGVAPVWQAAASILKTYSAFATRTRIPAAGTSTVWTNVTGLTKAVTTSGPATFIIMTYGSIEVISSAGNAGCEVKLQQNGVDVTNAFQTVDVVDAGGLSGTIGLWSFQTVVTVAAAGTYTFQVQAHKYTSAFDNFYAGGNTTAPAASQNQGALIIQQFDQ